DGSVGEMCGNGARCLARFARAAGVTIEPLRFETDAGVYEARVPTDPSADVRLLVPAPAGIVPTHALHDASQDPVFALNAGVPHALRFVDDVETVDVNTEGAAIRHDASFPEGANVDFVEAKADGRLRVRTYERGVECETDACGTGAVAAAVGAALAGVLPAAPQFEVPVDMNGGTLTVGFTLSDGVPAKVYLDGPAVYVYRGTVEV
ncbi:MAG: diaminopimelate epimerase, partial [Bacteroidota bacterium]